MSDPGWYPDPVGRFEVRYYDGAQWTDHVATAGQTGLDPLPDPGATVTVGATVPGADPAPPPDLATFSPQGGGAPSGSPGGNAGAVIALLAGVGLVVVLFAVGFFVLRSGDDGDDVVAGGSPDATSNETDGESTTAPPTTAPPTTAPPTTAAATTTVEPTTTTAQATTGAPAALDPRTAIPEYGSDPELDALADACEGGDYQACDELFFDSAIDSGYEAYGDSCGGRNEPAGLCIVIYGG